jgi:hypothetical protein
MPPHFEIDLVGNGPHVGRGHHDELGHRSGDVRRNAVRQQSGWSPSRQYSLRQRDDVPD